MELQPDCRFCFPPEPDRIILKTPNYYVMLSLGPIVEGYLLIVSRTHCPCVAALPSDSLREFTEVSSVVRDAQVATYGLSTYYEHGRTGTCLPDGRGEPHCFHAHLHRVPTDLDVGQQLSCHFDSETLSGWDELHRRYAASPEPYLLAESADRLIYAPDVGNVRRQFLRSLVGEHVDEPYLADWEAFPRRAEIDAARERLMPAISALSEERLGQYLRSPAQVIE